MIKQLHIAAYTRLLCLAICIFLSPALLFSQEVCNNGIDDDGDGLIDCYDNDCSQNALCSDFFYGKTPVACQSVPTITNFGLNTVWGSTILASTRSTMMVGDIDGDGKPEVVCHHDAANELYVLDGVTGSTKLTITCPAIDDVADALAIADVDNDGLGEIYAVTTSGTLRCFENTGIPKAGFTPPTTVGSEQAPGIYDFNGDGTPEVVVGNRIFNALTGALIAVAPSGSSKGQKAGQPDAAHPAVADVLPTAFCANCAGPELICGDEVFSVDIATATITLEASAPTGLGDGYTAIADLDHDGQLDIVVTPVGKMYMWDPRTGLQMGATIVLPGLVGRPNVADYDNDGWPEIGVAAEHVYKVIDDFNTAFAVKWSKVIVDNSGRTTGTAFDFECDGIAEVVYRDENNLFIWDGATGAVKASTQCGSATRTEYPTIVDVDDDGQVNIVCSCAASNQGGAGTVKAFNSNVNQWVSSRKVMNQHSYSVTTINEDLTVPKVMQNHAQLAKINNFLAQVPVYDVNWNSTCIPRPDLTVRIDTAVFTVCNNPSTVDITYTLCNAGSKETPSATNLSFYNGDPHAAGSFIRTDAVTTILPADTCVSITATLPYSANYTLYAYANDNALNTALVPNTDFPECDTLNNGHNYPISWTETVPVITPLNNPYCPADSGIALTATPVGGIFTGNGVTGTQFNAFNAGAGQHTITYTYATNGCSYDTTTEAIVSPKPQAGFAVSEVCEGVATAFTDNSSVASGSIAGYGWDFGDSGTDTQQNPTHIYPAQGAYNVVLVVTSDQGCLDTFNLPVTVNPNPVAVFSNTPVCFNQVTTFTEASTIGGNGSITQWGWNFDDGQTSALQNPTHTYAAAGNYNVSFAVASDKGCTDTTVQTATVNPPPTVAFSAPDVCLDANTAFNNASSVPNGSVASQLWDLGDGTISTDQSPNNQYAAAGTYTVKLVVVSDQGCSDSTQKAVVVFDPPLAAATATPACYAEGNGTADVDVTYGTPPFTYLWSNGGGSRSITGLFADNYDVEVTDANNCTARSSTAVTEPSGPLTVQVSPPSPSIDLGQTVSLVLSNNYSVPVAYQVSPPYALTCTTCPSFDATPYQTTTYHISLTDSNGCRGEGSFTILVDEAVPIFIPNAFTPNGDGNNDKWDIFSEAVKQFTVSVFNRWGEKVFESDNISKSWDGMAKGREAPAGVYVYTSNVVFLNNRTRQLKGTVTVIK